MVGRLQTLLLVFAALVVAAFTFSFVDGMLGGRWTGARGPALALVDEPVRSRADVARSGRTPARPEAATSKRERPNPAPAAGRVRVEVLNGAGRGGLARQAMDRLRTAGFDVVYFGNARQFGRDSTVVIDRAGNPEAARAVAAALGAGSVQSQPDPTLQLEVTVLLGLDWPPDAGGPSRRGRPVARLWRRLFSR